MLTAQILRRKGLGFESTKMLHDELQTHGIDLGVVHNHKAVADANIIFRWGCSSTVHHANPQFIFNPAKGMHRVTDKPGFRKLCIDNGVSCPQTFFHKDEALGWFDIHWNKNYTLIGRESYHAGGRNAEHIYTMEELENSKSDYWSVVIPKTNEYRVYCAWGRVVRVDEKIPNDPTALLWNHAQQGSKFVNIKWGSWPLYVVREALKAHELSKLDYEGVDIIALDGKAYVIESNSAPSLAPYGAKVYGKAFASVIEYVREHLRKPSHAPLPNENATWHDYIHPAVAN